MADPRDIINRYLPDLIEFLNRSTGVSARPLLASLLTAAVNLGVRSLAEYRIRVREAPVVPFAVAHRPTRREMAAYVRSTGDLAHLLPAVQAAESAEGGERQRLWEDLKRRIGETQAELAAPLVGQRGAVAQIDGFLATFFRTSPSNLPVRDRRVLLREIAKYLEEKAVAADG